MPTLKDLVKINDYLWEVPQNYRSDMKVPARLYASEKMLDEALKDRSLEQLINVAALSGINRYALAMPDIHEGYGFPVGGVAAFSLDEGVISPGGIGYDINCGVRLLRSGLNYDEAQPFLEKLAEAIYREVPSGVGRGGRLNLKRADLDRVLEGGAERMTEVGYGYPDDLIRQESGGVLEEADASLVSEKAKARGRDQLGTMGAGNHFVEVGRVDAVFDYQAAETLGLRQNQVTVLIHTGSRGLGHQIATDYIQTIMRAMPKYKIVLPDRELACAPFNSPEGQNYFKAMAAGANFAWANRQLIVWEVRKAWKEIMGESGGELDMVYDVAHNIAKIEEYIGSRGQPEKMIIHRKGATRAFPGQPVLIPGSMGTASYVLLGQEKAKEESFGSSCHGAGRRMSRTRARRQIQGRALKEQLNQKGIIINAGSLSGLAEEAPAAYKDVNEVVEVVHRAGIAKKVAKLVPVLVVKG